MKKYISKILIVIGGAICVFIGTQTENLLKGSTNKIKEIYNEPERSKSVDKVHTLQIAECKSSIKDLATKNDIENVMNKLAIEIKQEIKASETRQNRKQDKIQSEIIRLLPKYKYVDDISLSQIKEKDSMPALTYNENKN